MAQTRHFTFRSSDKVTDIHAVEWIPEGRVRAVMQIAHGMQEFIERYDDFAHYLCGKGFVVVGNDHLGHGKSIRAQKDFGYFADQNGNVKVISDMNHLHRMTAEKYPDVPYFLLGHSMGSFLARQYLCLYGQELDGAVISGTAWHSSFESVMGMTLCRLLASRKGWHYRSRFITKLAMGNYNRKFEPVRTKYDWLTRDEAVVDAYRSDERTQFMFTLNGFYNMFKGLKFLTDSRNLRRMPQSLPVLFIAGEMDPVGNYGAGVKRAFVCLRSLGMKDVQCKLYPHDRHEVLNELDRQDVYADVGRWLDEHMSR